MLCPEFGSACIDQSPMKERLISGAVEVQQKPPLSTTFLGHETDKGITGTGTSGEARTDESFIYHYDWRRRRMATASDTKIDVTLAATLYSSYNAPLPSQLSSQPNSCDGLSLSQASSTSSSLHQPAKMGTIDKALARDKEWRAAVALNEQAIHAARLRLIQ